MRNTFRRRWKSASYSPPSHQQILFLDTGTNDSEVEAAWLWLKTRFPAAHRIFPEQIPEHGHNDILWWHGTEKSEIKNPKSEILRTLRRFLKSGGRLFLSLAAVQAVVPLGLEKEWPDIAEAGLYDPQSKPAHEWVAPQGFELRGLMGFLAHLPARAPHILSPFGGGIYLWNARAGTPYWRFGYGPSQWPKGNVWGVHRYYIGFDPAQKLAWEYDEPAVLCVGAHLYFSDAQNIFRQHLEAFAEACLRHLLARSQGAKKDKEPKDEYKTKLCWEPAVAEIKKNNRLIDFPKSEAWTPIKWLEVSPHLTPSRESNQFFDLAGERILLMGSERGRITEIWSHPLRLCRNISLQIKDSANETQWDNAHDAEVIIRPHQIERRRATERVAITERIWVSHEAPLACVDWEFDGHEVLDLALAFDVDFRLMWPYPEGALSKLEYQIFDRRGRLCCSQIHFSDYRRLFRVHFALAFERGLYGRARTLDRTLFDAPSIVTEVEDISENNVSRARVTFHWRLEVKGKSSTQFVMLGGEASDPQLQELLTTFPEQLPKSYAQQAGRKYHVLEKFAEIDTPDPLFNAAARWAKMQTEAFVSNSPSLGRSLLAGFANTGEGWNSGRPGYAWFFGRDACWTAFGMLHYGDFESVKAVLRFLGRHQDINGKILHELTTSGAAHYDAADATPLYVILLERYLSHSGDLAFVKREWPHLEKAMAFLAATDRDGDGLIENTGVGHGWIEGGQLFGAHVEHYLAGCWAEALHAAAQLAMRLDKTALAEHWILQHQKARNLLEQEFWNEKEGYFYHGKNADGTFNANVTALAAVPLLFGYGKPGDGIQALRRLAGKSFNADWGVRLVADDHPFYNPQDYHSGSVWPLFTGWTALAEFRYGRWLQGLMHLKNAMRNYQHGALGCVEEVLHGEVYQPTGVCPHQAWSESMLLQSLYEGWLGFKPHALERRLELAPYIPLYWPFLSAGPIRLDDQQILFYFQREENVLTFQFKARLYPGKTRREPWQPVHVDFKPIFPATTQLEEIRRDHHLVEVKPEQRTDLIRWPLAFDVSGETTTITLRLAKFFTAAAPFAEAAPGERSRGWVILDQHVKGKTVAIEVEGEATTAATLELVTRGYEIMEVNGGKLIEVEGELGSIAFEFPARGHLKSGDNSAGRYSRHIIEITLR